MKLFYYLLFLSIASIASHAQPAKNILQESGLLKSALLKNHFNAPSLDNTFSLLVYNSTLNELDPDKLFFTEKDLQGLKVYQNTIDDELKENKLSFLTAVSQLYKVSLARAESAVQQSTVGALDLVTKEILKVDTLWPADNLALNEQWRQEIKYNVLVRLAELQGEYLSIPDIEFLKKFEADARQRVKLTKLRSIKRILDYPEGFENYVASVYLKSIASAFDPHSAYMSSREMESFITSLSTEGYYFGITINENERGDIVIGQLTPGGSAWKSGAVHAGDVIRQLQWEGKELIDLEGIGIEEANEMLEVSNHTTLEFTLSNLAGQRSVVKLKKEKIESQENIVKSFILHGDKKIGYISLPGFYTNWGEGGGSNCANDVATEILKLKKENIEGLIMDVRFNGGGSLGEAVAMSGIFIDAGPMGLLKDKAGVITTVKDINRGTVYDGPLILLVNELSASASEFLAAALQDYHRAIIVGGQTYGKATMQDVVPLDPKGNKNALTSDTKSKLGFAKITIGKIYRITGKTAQLVGVTPDISLPDAISQLKFREAYTPLALPSDSVQKKTYYQTLGLLPLVELKTKSQSRVTGNMQFEMLEQYGKWVAVRQNEIEPVTLTWQHFKKQIASDEQEYLKLKNGLNAGTSSFKVTGHRFQQQQMQMG